MTERSKPTLTVPLEALRLIDKVYLPSNLNKVRSAHPDVIQAVKDFRRFILEAARAQGGAA